MLKEMSNSDLGQILQTCPVGLALSDEQQKITWVNETFENYLGISASEISGQNINDLPEILKPLFTSSSLSSGAVHIPANSIRDEQWYMCNQAQLNGTTAHYITDVGPLHLLMQERELLREELREALAIDEITGMPNKVALLKNLESQISRSRRYNNPLSIIILRLNNIEQLNNAQTASLFISISHLLNDQVRWADIVGKLSHSDFLLVLPETSVEACKNLTDNLTQHLNNLTLSEELPADYKITTSFGYAEWAKGDDLTLLMKKARDVLN
ncbi:MAG: diguanylate cyclase [Gammaproteobacteria bacterium]|nr:diguanylate cyclase [Gammaproteobacteria bacterium]